MIEQNLSKQILKAFYTVHYHLGYGFLEKVYEQAMLIELKKLNLSATNQQKIDVYYDKQLIGEYIADIVVNDRVIIELKATKDLSVAHEAQLLNYLKATKIEVGLLLNFGPKAEFTRKVYTNSRKRFLS